MDRSLNWNILSPGNGKLTVAILFLELKTSLILRTKDPFSFNISLLKARLAKIISLFLLCAFTEGPL